MWNCYDNVVWNCYDTSVYDNGYAANDDKLLKSGNFLTRTVAGLRKYDHVSRARGDLLGLHTPRQMYCFVRVST